MDNLELFLIGLTQARTTVNSFLFTLHFQSQTLLQGPASMSFLEDEEVREYACLRVMEVMLRWAGRNSAK